MPLKRTWFIAIILLLFCVGHRNTAAATTNFLKVDAQAQSGFQAQFSVPVHEVPVLTANNSLFELYDAARIRQRYHERMAAFLFGSAVSEPEAAPLILSENTQTARQLNSVCLSSCYDLLFLFSLF